MLLKTKELHVMLVWLDLYWCICVTGTMHYIKIQFLASTIFKANQFVYFVFLVNKLDIMTQGSRERNN